MLKNKSRVLRILCVEPDEEIIARLKQAVRGTNSSCEISHCPSGEQTIELLGGESANYDLLLISHDLPGMGGVELCSALRSGGLDVPMVMLTENGLDEVTEQAFKAGVQDCLSKDRLAPGDEILSKILLKAAVGGEETLPPGSETIARFLKKPALQTEFLTQLIDCAPIGIAVVKAPQYRFTVANPAFTGFIGDPPASILGRTVDEVFPDPLAETFKAHLDQVLQTGEPVGVNQQEAYSPANGRARWWDIFHVPIRGAGDAVDSVLIMAQEITGLIEEHRKHSATAMEAEANLAMLQAVIGSMSDGLIMADSRGNIVDMNPAALAILGFNDLDQAQNRLKNISHVFEIRDATGAELGEDGWIINRVLRGERVAYHESTLRNRNTGELVNLSCSGTAVYDPKGEISLVVSVIRDVTNHKLLERELRESRNRFRQIAENIDGVLWMTDPARQETLYVSPRCQDVLGLSDKIICTNPEVFRERIHPDDKEPVLEAWSGDEKSDYDVTFRYNHPDGREIWLRDRAFPIRNRRGEVYRIVGVTEDITEQKRTQESLHRSAQQYRALVENAPDIIARFDTGKRLTFMNPAAESLIRGPKDKVLAKPLKDIKLPKKLQGRIESALDEVFQKQCEIVFQSDFRFAGRTRGFDIRLTPEFSKDGELESALVIARDMSDRILAEKELEAERSRLQTILDSVPEGIVVADKNCRVLMTNPAADRIYNRPVPYGESYQAHAEMNICLADGTPCPPRDLPLTRAALDGEVVENMEMCIVWEDGQRRDILVHAAPLFDRKGRLNGAVGLFQDITAQKEAQRERLALLDTLKRQAEELKAQKHAAEEAAQAKSVFLANMSHEIRTPMNALLGMTRLVLSNELDDKQRGRVEIIRESAMSLLEIVNDILDYSKIEAGKLKLEEKQFNLASLAQSVVNEFKVLAENRGLSLELTLDPDLPKNFVGDRQRLRQVLTNLISNAVKFTEQGRVEIAVEGLGKPYRAADMSNAVIRFSVSDTGIGIPEDRLPDIFDSFTQVDSSYTKVYAGTGLGLAICKKLVELLGGSIWAESVHGRGSRFSFIVPLQIGEEGEGEKKEKHEDLDVYEDVESLNILLAEDNKVNQVLAVELLEDQGHRVTVVENGEQALEALARTRFDLVLMDVQMPVMDGMTATRIIREHNGSKFDPGIPVVGLSAYAMKGDREKFLAAGMDYYMTKPLEVDNLFNILGALTRDKKTRGTAGSSVEPETCSPGIDWESLSRRYKGKTGLIRKVLRMYLDSSPEQIERIRLAVEQEERKQARDLVHSLCGSSAVVGARGVEDACRGLGEALKQDDRGRIEKLLHELEQAYGETARFISGRLDNI